MLTSVLRRKGRWCAVLVAVWFVTPTAQQPTPPSKGTALIVGRVVDASTSQPLDSVVVSIQAFGVRDSVLSDAQGRFLFRDLAKGSYLIRTEGNGLIAGAYGRNWPSTDVAPVTVGEGERVTNLTVRVWRYASIGGRVLDETGDPIVGATVRALLRSHLGGRATFSWETFECGGACLIQRTDDRGAYRFSRLIPGDYIVVVPSVTSAAPTSLQRLVAKGENAVSKTYPETTVMAMAWLGGGGTVAPLGSGIRTPDDRIAIGDVDRSVPIASLTETGQLFIFPTQFYPSALRVNDAEVLALGSGEARIDADIRLRSTKAVTVSGVLSAEGGGPAPDYLMRLVPVDQDLLDIDPEIATTVSDVDGSFTFVGVPSDNYVIKVLRRPSAAMRIDTSPVVVQSNVGAGSPGVVSASPRAQPTDPIQWAETRVNVASADVRGVAVTLRTGARIAGRIAYVGAAPKPERGPNLEVSRADGRRSVNLSQSQVAVDPSGRFETQGHIPGDYLLQVLFAPADWYFRSAVYQGRDVSEVPFAIVDADARDLVVTLADKPWTTLAGTVTTASGSPADAVMVIVFAADPARWTNVGRVPRRMIRTNVDRRGAFTVTNLPPGDYLAVALQTSSVVPWQDPATLKRLVPLAAKVSLQDGQSGTVTLRSQAWSK